MAFTEPVLLKRIPDDASKRHTVWYDEYEATGGYAQLRRALEMTPESEAGLKSGVTTAVQSSNTWLMGYTVARMLTMAARGDKLPEGFVPTKATTFTKANIDDIALRENDPAKFYAKDIQALFGSGMPAAQPIEDAWKPAVRANLEVSLRLGRLVDEFALPDETEPAPIFTV